MKKRGKSENMNEKSDEKTNADGFVEMVQEHI
jgi:hypothetical protein